MPTINVSVRYEIPQADALKRIQEYFSRMKTQYSGSISNLQESWDGYIGTFSGSGRGFSVSGHVSVNPGVVIVDLAVPIVAIVFKGPIEANIRGQLTQLLR